MPPLKGYVKCRNCKRDIYINLVELRVGFYDNDVNMNPLNIILDDVKMMFKCPDCNEPFFIGIVFVKNEPPKIEMIVDNPSYIG